MNLHNSSYLAHQINEQAEFKQAYRQRIGSAPVLRLSWIAFIVTLLSVLIVSSTWLSAHAHEHSIPPQDVLVIAASHEVGPDDFRISDVGSGVSGDAHAPAVAYNVVDDEYLVVWDADDTSVAGIVDGEHEIFGQRIDAMTGLEIAPNDFRISTVGPAGDASFDARDAAVAHNPIRNEYLVVWEGDAAQDDGEIHGQFLAADGTEIGQDFQISFTGAHRDDTRYSAARPAVVFNPQLQQYLVVWRAHSLFDEEGEFITETEIVGTLLDGNTREKLSDYPFRISRAAPAENESVRADNPAVVYSAQQQEYVVVWRVSSLDSSLPAETNNIFAQRLRPNGMRLRAEDIQVSQASGQSGDTIYAVSPGISYNPNRQEYLVVWGTIGAGGSTYVHGQRLHVDGSELGVSDFPISPSNEVGASPAVAYQPTTGQFLVTWLTSVGAGDTLSFEVSGALLDSYHPDTVGVGAFPVSNMGPENVTVFDVLYPDIACPTLHNRCLSVWARNDDVDGLTPDEIEIFGQLVSDGFELSALDDGYFTFPSKTLNAAAPGVLQNDLDPNGQPLAAQLVTPPQHGTFTLNADGSFSYQPNANFSGVDWFTYRATTSNGDTSRVASVSIEVLGSVQQKRFSPLTRWVHEYHDDGGWTPNDAYWSTIQFPDINGDGKADVCGRSSVGIYCAVAEEDGTGFGAPTHWESSFSDANGWHTDPTSYPTIQFPDLNNDGKADVCGRNATGLLCGLSDGASFSPSTPWSTEYGSQGWGNHESHWGTLRFPDLNGDGRADVCARSTAGIFCGLAKVDGTGFAQPTHWENSISNANGWRDDPSHWATIQFPDINGDGKADVCGRGDVGIYCGIASDNAFTTPTLWLINFSDAAGWNTDPAYWATIRFHDVDGDNKADVCGRGAAGIYCGLSTGDAFSTLTLWSDNFSDKAGWRAHPSFWQTIQYPDLNQDGKADICGRFVNGIQCALSTGTWFARATDWQFDFADGRGWDANANNYQKILFPDVTGDGKADICGRHADGIFCGINKIDTPEQSDISGLEIAVSNPTVTLGSAVELSASVATGSNVQYAWDLGDGNSASGATVSHMYTEQATYSVTVTASNNNGQLTTATQVSVTPRDPNNGQPYQIFLPLVRR